MTEQEIKESYFDAPIFIISWPLNKPMPIIELNKGLKLLLQELKKDIGNNNSAGTE